MPTLPLLEADAIEGAGGLSLDLSRSISASSSGKANGRFFTLDRAMKLPEALVLEVGAGRRVGLLGTCIMWKINPLSSRNSVSTIDLKTFTSTHTHTRAAHRGPQPVPAGLLHGDAHPPRPRDGGAAPAGAHGEGRRRLRGGHDAPGDLTYSAQRGWPSVIARNSNPHNTLPSTHTRAHSPCPSTATWPPRGSSP